MRRMRGEGREREGGSAEQTGSTNSNGENSGFAKSLIHIFASAMDYKRAISGEIFRILKSVFKQYLPHCGRMCD